MAKEFFERLARYYADVAAVLRGDAHIAAVFPNASDIGSNRERVYQEFLRQHAPAKCQVFLGGFLFGEDGTESKQLDVIITTDTTPRFDFHNRHGTGKSFSPVDGTLGVASIKSKLDKMQLEDALLGIASIPANPPLDGRIPDNLEFRGYEDWPYKIIYATGGIEATTLHDHLLDFYRRHPDIPLGRRPNMIHVLGKYCIVKAMLGMRLFLSKDGKTRNPAPDEFVIVQDEDNEHTSDVTAILWTLEGLQTHANASSMMLFRYDYLLREVLKIPEHARET